MKRIDEFTTHVHMHIEDGDFVVFSPWRRFRFVEMKSHLRVVRCPLAISAQFDVVFLAVLPKAFVFCVVKC